MENIIVIAPSVRCALQNHLRMAYTYKCQSLLLDILSGVTLAAILPGKPLLCISLYHSIESCSISPSKPCQFSE